MATVSLTVTPPTLAVNDVAANEGNLGPRLFTFTVTLSSSVSRTITVDYATADGTATAPDDYVPATGRLIFLAGETSKTVTVLVNGDTAVEPDETFFVNLSNGTTPIARSKGTGTIVNDDTGFLHLAGEAVDPAPDVRPLTREDLAPIVAAAEARWAAAGVDTAALGGVDIRIADLPGTILGETTTNVIYLDADAAGHGWFVDPTPADDAEFAAAGDPAVAGRVDLLTVVAHEMGHALGLEHAAAGVMQEALGLGVRHPVGCNCPLCTAAAAASTPATPTEVVPTAASARTDADDPTSLIPRGNSSPVASFSPAGVPSGGLRPSVEPGDGVLVAWAGPDIRSDGSGGQPNDGFAGNATEGRPEQQAAAAGGRGGDGDSAALAVLNRDEATVTSDRTARKPADGTAVDQLFADRGDEGADLGLSPYVG